MIIILIFAKDVEFVIRLQNVFKNKKGYSIVLRTGPNMKECKRLIESIEHFYGHLEIECCGSLGLCSIEFKEAVAPRQSEIIDFCKNI